MPPKVLSTLVDESRVIYIVQTTFPSGTDHDNTRFSTFMVKAYVHVDSPREYLCRTHPELFPNLDLDDGCEFNNYHDAKRLADALRQHGRLRCGWERDTPWSVEYRKPLFARIVIESKRVTRHLIEG